MLKSWFNTREVDAFAEDLAAEFARRCPPSVAEQSRLRGATDLMMSRTQVFAERHKLNLLKRAKLANTLKWKLNEFGYDRETVDRLVLEATRIITLIRSDRKTG